MIKRLLLTLACLLMAPLAHAQFGNTTTVPASGAPAGSCGPLLFYVNTANGDLYDCLTGSWHAIGGGGGSGTVTNVATTSPITGGPITTTGTIACATCTTSAAALTSGDVLTGASSQGMQASGTQLSALAHWNPSRSDGSCEYQHNPNCDDGSGACPNCSTYDAVGYNWL